jgi:hypothetical protein
MALTLNEAITEVRYLLNEATASFWSDAEITDYIQEGCRIASSKGLLYEVEVDLTLVADTLTYAATDIVEVNHAYYWTATGGAGNYKGLIKISPNQLGNLATFTSGRPKYYVLHNRLVYVWPLPTTAESGETGKIKLLCSKETDDITNLNDEYQHLPIIYAAAKGKQKDSKFGEANSLFQQFYSDVAFEREDKINREVDTFDDFRIKPTRPQGGQSGAQR